MKVNDICKITEEIKKINSFSKKPYLNRDDDLIVGYGRNLNRIGITLQEAELLLINEILENKTRLKAIFSNYIDFNEDFQQVLLLFCCLIGWGQFKKEKEIIEAVNNMDLNEIIRNIITTYWYRSNVVVGETIIQKLKEISEM